MLERLLGSGLGRKVYFARLIRNTFFSRGLASHEVFQSGPNLWGREHRGPVSHVEKDHRALGQSRARLIAGHEHAMLQLERLGAEPGDARPDIHAARKMQLVEVVDDEPCDDELQIRAAETLQRRIHESNAGLLEKSGHGCVVDVSDRILVAIADRDRGPVIVIGATAPFVHLVLRHVLPMGSNRFLVTAGCVRHAMRKRPTWARRALSKTYSRSEAIRRTTPPIQMTSSVLSSVSP